MKQFFKFTFASILGFFVAGFLLIFVFFSFLFSVLDEAEGLFGEKNRTKIEENSVLHLTLSTPIEDYKTNNPFEDFNINTMKPNKKLGLKGVLDAITIAKDDDKIKGIFLDLSYVPTNFANSEELRDNLVEFKESGKFIVSYSETFNQKSYWMASVADKIYINPAGDIVFKGLATELMFFKGLLSKAEIDMQIIRGSNNKFKSAVEPFMYDKMSDANREQMTLLVGGIWNKMVSEIASSRNLTVDELNRIADGLLATHPDKAIELGLIDAKGFKDEVIADLMERVEVDAEDDLEFISLKKYAKTAKKTKSSKDDGEDDKKEKPWIIKERIAVIYASGEIRSGESQQGIMGSETIAKAIKDARQDSTVKAIVLRVNSPGGSALASDVMWRETQLAKAEKPLIVSMGGVAASGGYYIACGADKIYADVGTITGSIGVFGVIPNMKKMFNNKLGITFDGVMTNENANVESVSKALTEYQYLQIQKMVDKIYSDFTSKVAEGRGLTQAYVDSIGQGRVWLGTDAKNLGLVDEMGGLEDAIAYAEEKTGLENAKLKIYPEAKDPIKALLEDFDIETKAFLMGDEMVEEIQLYKQIKRVKEMSGIQAIIPYRIDFY